MVNAVLQRKKVIPPVPLVAALTIFTYVLFYTYKLKVAPAFYYQGLTFRDPDRFYFPVAIGLVALVALALPRNIEKVSDFILWVLFVLGVAPSILIVQFAETLEPVDGFKMGLAIAVTTAMVAWLTRHPPKSPLPIPRLEKGIDFWLLLILFSGLVYGTLLMTSGLSFQFLALEDVYSTRGDFGAAVSGNLIVGYLMPLQANIVNPIFIAKGILSRRAAPFIMGVSGQVLLYLTAGHKSTLFSLAAVVAIVWLFRLHRDRPIPGAMILIGITMASLAALVADRATGGTLWTSLISRRLMIVPGALTSAYVRVFQDEPRQNFATVVPLIPDPYENTRPVNIVGARFVGDSSTAANVNLFGDGYLQFGYIGMFVEGAVLAILLIWANRATRDLPLILSCIVFFGATLALVSSSIFSTALTHGLFAAIIACAVMPKGTWYRQKKPRRRVASSTPRW